MGARQNKSLSLKRRKYIIITFAVLLAAVLCYDLSALGGNIRFYAKWIECGQKPVEAAFDFNHPPYYVESPVISGMRLSPPMFCTPLEAEQAGYSANPNRYEFPHIEKARASGAIQ